MRAVCSAEHKPSKVPPACTEHATVDSHYLYPATDGRLNCRLLLQQSHLQPSHLQPTIQIQHSHPASDTSNQHQLQHKWICSDFVIFKYHTPQSPGSRHLLPHQGCMTCYTSWAPGAKHSYRKPPMPTNQPTCMPG